MLRHNEFLDAMKSQRIIDRARNGAGYRRTTTQPDQRRLLLEEGRGIEALCRVVIGNGEASVPYLVTLELKENQYVPFNINPFRGVVNSSLEEEIDYTIFFTRRGEDEQVQYLRVAVPETGEPLYLNI